MFLVHFIVHGRRTAHADFVLDALEQGSLIADLPAGAALSITATVAANVSIKHTERLAEAVIEPSAGSVGDSYDNALAETINGLYPEDAGANKGRSDPQRRSLICT